MKLFFKAVRVALVMALFTATGASAVSFTNIYNFDTSSFTVINGSLKMTNGTGLQPVGIVVSGNVVYGSCYSGGTNGDGGVFRVNTDGTQFTNLVSFYLGTYDSNGVSANSLGANPNCGIVLISNAIYGTTYVGGRYNAGTVYKINTDGSGFSTVYNFDYTNGRSPQAGLTLYSNALYGAASSGGTNNYGTLWKVSLSDLTFTRLFQFLNPAAPWGNVAVNATGIFGFSAGGGATNLGFIYNQGGADLLDFTGTNGATPYSAAVMSGNTLFGTTFDGGTNGSGNIFRINTDGTHYTNLYSFTASDGGNVDGASPYDSAGMILSGNTLYGTTSGRGSGGQGTVFQINTDGSGFAVLHSFQYSDGSQPEALWLTNGTLYGVANYGIQGISLGSGGVFAIVLQPTLNITEAGTNAILTWTDPSYSLYSAPTVTNTFTIVPGATSPYTNGITGKQKYFRLQ